MKKVSKKISEAERNYNKNMNILANELLPNYENSCLREYLKFDINQDYEEKMIFGKGKNEKLIQEKAYLVKKKKL